MLTNKFVSMANTITKGGPEHVESLVANMAKDSINLHNFLASSEDDIECNDITLRLTLDGCDLGKEYSGWWYKTGGMWFAEYRGHWCWIVVGYIVGVISGLLIGTFT